MWEENKAKQSYKRTNSLINTHFEDESKTDEYRKAVRGSEVRTGKERKYTIVFFLINEGT